MLMPELVMEKYDHLDFKPPATAAKEAAEGLAMRNDYNRGGTGVGVARARDLKNRKVLSPDTVRRMKAYFDRHEVDKKGTGWNRGEEGYPSAGLIAWKLWGGNAGRTWAVSMVSRMNREDDGPKAK